MANQKILNYEQVFVVDPWQVKPFDVSHSSEPAHVAPFDFLFTFK